MSLKVIESSAEMRAVSEKIRSEGKTIGFVPTMGALHSGHVSLVRQAKKENHIVVASIFVNPIQFGPNEDFSRYPRTFEEDCSLLEEAGCSYVFFPSVEEMYKKNFQTYIDLKELPNHLCGLSREGHFRGVCTVVTKLFNIVFPNSAYFGQKDYQQAAIIRQMILDLNQFVEIKVMPIVREPDGLAMSSRNKYLSETERKDAVILNQVLLYAEKRFSEGEVEAEMIIKEMRKVITDRVSYARIDYINIIEPDTLLDISEIIKRLVRNLITSYTNLDEPDKIADLKEVLKTLNS